MLRYASCTHPVWVSMLLFKTAMLSSTGHLGHFVTAHAYTARKVMILFVKQRSAKHSATNACHVQAGFQPDSYNVCTKMKHQCVP